MRLFIVDDHELVREGLKALVERLPGFVVVGEAADGHAALEAIAHLEVDLALVDLSMPSMPGLELVERLRAQHPALKVLVVSMHADPTHVRRALEVGASGYLLKDASTSELEVALRAIARGGTFLSPGVAGDVIRGFVGHAAGEGDPLGRLTSRQREILVALAQGHTARVIARRLGLSAKTVETHRTHIMERLEIFDLPGLVRFAVRHGLVRDE